jgi:hypothetical protein
MGLLGIIEPFSACQSLAEFDGPKTFIIRHLDEMEHLASTVNRSRQ